MALLRFSSRFVKNAKNSNNKIKVITRTTRPIFNRTRFRIYTLHLYYKSRKEKGITNYIYHER